MSVRLNNYIQKFAANQDQIELFIANLANSPEPEKLVDVANQITQLSISESIPLYELEGHVKQPTATCCPLAGSVIFTPSDVCCCGKALTEEIQIADAKSKYSIVHIE